MFWIIFLSSTIAFGFTIVQYISIDRYPFCFYFGISWIFGSMLTSLLIFIIHFIIPFNFIFVLLILIIQCATVYFIGKYLKKKRKSRFLKISLIRFENSAGLYSLLFCVSLIISIHLFLCFCQYPYTIPKEANEFIDLEISFISSVRYGINKRRSNIFFYKDPLNSNDYFPKPSLPFLYTAVLETFGLDYAEASIIICFLNTICASIFLYHYTFHFSHHPFLVCICFMFNGGLSFFRILFGSKCENNDYMRNICYKTPVPWYSIIGTLLVFSKEFSFSLPLSIVSVMFAQFHKKQNAFRQFYLISAIALTLNPSVGSSTCIFMVCSCFSKSFKYIMPFIITLIPKYIGVYFQDFPVWREYQMFGVFYACLVVWFDQFGPMLLSMFLPVPAIDDNSSVHRHLTFTSAFLLINLFRFGNSSFENIVAIMTVILPMICIYFVEDLFFFEKIFGNNNQIQQGIFSGIFIFIYVTFIIGGIVCIFTISTNHTIFLDKYDIQCGEWIKKNINRFDLIISDPVKNNPGPLIGGHQILCGDMKILWQADSNVTKSLQYIRQIEINKNFEKVMQNIGAKYLLLSQQSIFNRFIKIGEGELSSLFENQNWKVFKRHN